MKNTADNESSSPHGRVEDGGITAKELAFLAAILSPEECKSGAAGSALRHALALFEESDELLRNIGAAKTLEKKFEFAGDTPGGQQLFEVWSRQIETEWSRPLRLDCDESSGTDEVREYLSKHCNLEGKRRSTWKTIRTVWANFEAMFVWEANRHNEHNRDRIIAAEKLTSELDCGSAGAGSQPSRLLYDDEQWESWDETLKGFKSAAARYEQVSTKRWRLTHYEIRPLELQWLVEWKRRIKTHGGIKAVKPRTREDVLGVVKKSNPKKKK